MEWLIYAVFGWCGTNWPWHPRGGGNGGGGDDPWPINCPMCGGLIGAVAAVLIYPQVSAGLVDAGFIGMAVTNMAIGGAVSGLVRGVLGMVRGK